MTTMQRHIPSLLITKPEHALQAVIDYLDEDFTHPHSDVLLYDETASLGIDDVREVIDFTRTRPYGLNYAYVVMLAAHMLTVPAQHALLKTLEEHPPYARIILCSPTQDALLETVRSRMQVIRPASVSHNAPAQEDEHVALWLSLNGNTSAGERTSMVAPVIRSRDKALTLVDTLIQALRIEAHSQPATSTSRRLSLLLETYQRLQGNAHVGLTMEHMAMAW